MVRSIILAAGSSTRMGRPKALLDIGGLTFLGHILRNHHALGLPVTVILGEHQAEIQAGVDLTEAAVLVNPHPELGPLSSLKIGLQSSEESEAVLIHPVDHPLVRVDSLRGLLDSHHASPHRIIVPQFGARRGHPVLFPRLFYDELLAAPLDQGARYVVWRRPETVLILKVPDEGVIQNIDTPKDYDRLVRAVQPDQI
jgi:molybdenum cofactor cytidylyltransferase